ncbi:hypothetical protein [Streptomyces sp. NPDC002133]|uniref:hypothetical protein n=1 Tax=Streptomyces sp. NPDC002133 TaxID=3154409 RepID=UPI00331E6D06
MVEDLNVAGMLNNRKLARFVADAGFGEIRRRLACTPCGTAVGSKSPTAGSAAARHVPDAGR